MGQPAQLHQAVGLTSGLFVRDNRQPTLRAPVRSPDPAGSLREAADVTGRAPAVKRSQEPWTSCSGGTVGPRLRSGRTDGRGTTKPHQRLLTFAYDEAALICRHWVGYLLDATRGSHSPVATATTSTSGHREASEAISLLGRKQSSSDDFCHCHRDHFSAPGRR